MPHMNTTNKPYTIDFHTEYVHTGVRSKSRERKAWDVKDRFHTVVASFSGVGAKGKAKAEAARLNAAE